MAFATNSSAFGIKPQTQTTSLFGSNQQQPSSSTAFGASTQQPQSTLFGSTQNQQQPSTTNNLFGQPTNQQQQPAGNNLFGQSTNQQQPAAGTNIFGSTNQQAPAAGGNLFGQSTNQQQPLPAGNLFGQSTQQPQTQQQQPTNAFGSNLFGGLTTTQPNQSTTQPQQGAFGGFMSNTQQQPQQQPTNGLFGGNTLGPNTQGNAFGGGFGTGNTSLFGAKPPQQQQSVGLQGGMNTAANVPAVTKNTKFNDLPEEMKRTLEQIDTYIQGRVQISKDLHQRKLGEEPLKGQELIRNIHKELINAASIIRNDVHATQDLKAKVDQAVEDTIVATRIVDEFRNPPAGSAYRKDHAAFPLEFFSRVTNQMKDRLTWYKATIEAIERKLSATTTQSQTPQGISATLQAQHQTFIALASKTAAVDAELQKIKALYTQLWRAKTGSVRDPFNDLDTSIVDHRKGDFGMSALSFR